MQNCGARALDRAIAARCRTPKRLEARPRRSARAQGRARAAQQRHGQARAGRARQRRQVHQHRQAGARGGVRSAKARVRAARRCGRGWMPSGSISRFPRPACGPAACIRSRRSSGRSKTCSVSLGFTVLDGPEVETEYPQFRRAEYSGGSSGARHAGYVLARRRPSAAHAHVARAGARHGEAGAAAAHDRAGPRVPQRERGRFARAHVLSARRHDDRSQCFGRQPDLFHEDAADRDLPARCDGAAAAGIFSRSSSRDSSWISGA